ncbi:MAG: pectate lyase [Paludibacter sp.]|nr:pectate lyase [Paludibacter sp.]
MKNLKFLPLLVLMFITSLSFSQTPAFPTAEGYGKYAAGGRGGQVVFVENLDDYIAYNNIQTPIPGSFRWALTQYPGQPLTVIFRVSGTIKLKPYIVSGKNQNDIRCQRPNLTIAGQTAPGEGICIRNSKVNLGGSVDLIVRNMRFRIGENAADSTFIPGGSIGIENATNLILDHCVFGWSGEENITMYDNRFSTVQWSVMHEGLYDDGHGKGNRSYGGQCGGVNATWHHNLFAHNYSRSPRLNGARTNNEVKVFIEFINNVNYNWGRSGAAYGGESFPGVTRSHTCNYVGNYFKPGPATDGNKVFFNVNIVADANFPKWYVAGNKMVGSTALDADNWAGMTISWNKAGTIADIKSDTLLLPPSNIVSGGKWIEYAPYKINIQTADEAFQSVLDKSGTINRDSVERRVIREVKTGTAIYKASLGRWGIIDKSFDAEGFMKYADVQAPVDNDRDGMADEWELANGLNPVVPDDRNMTTADGYTALEVYLNSLMGEDIPHNFVSGL